MAYSGKKGISEGSMVKEETNVTYEIINEIGVVSDDGKWRLELNRISWNGREPKYDLRKWSPNHEKMGKGVTLTEEELIALSEILSEEKKFLLDNQK